MDRSQHWTWFALICVVLLFHAWVTRYEYSGCDLDGCVVIDRWTGELYFEPLETEPPTPITGTRLVRHTPEGPTPRGAAPQPRPGGRVLGERLRSSLPCPGRDGHGWGFGARAGRGVGSFFGAGLSV